MTFTKAAEIYTLERRIAAPESRLAAAQALVEKWRRDKRAMIFAGPITGILQGRVEATQEHTDELATALKGDSL